MKSVEEARNALIIPTTSSDLPRRLLFALTEAELLESKWVKEANDVLPLH